MATRVIPSWNQIEEWLFTFLRHRGDSREDQAIISIDLLTSIQVHFFQELKSQHPEFRLLLIQL